MRIEPIELDVLDALEISTADLRIVVVTSIGPRIAHFGQPGKPNLLYWKNNQLGREGWQLYGGHRVWVTRPGADESEDAYRPDNEPCEVVIQQDGVSITGPVDPVLRIQRGLHIREITSNTLEVTASIKNQGPMLYSGGVWSPTCIDPSGGKEFAVPLGDRRQTWDTITLVIPRSFAGHSSLVNDPQVTFNEDFMIVRPVGVELKRMVRAPLGIVAMTWPTGHVSFIKHASFNALGQYPLQCNIAVYNGPENFMFEMETYGVEQPVQPGQTITNRETWVLLDQVLDWTDVGVLTAQLPAFG